MRVNTKDLLDAIKRARQAVDKTEPRYYLKGIYFDCECEGLCITATDGKLLVTTKITPTAYTDIPPFILPVDAADLLIKCKKQLSAEHAELTIDKNSVQFKIGDITISSKVIDGNYPDYRKVIPSDLNSDILFNARELESHMERLGSAWAKTKKKTACLWAEEDKVELSVNLLDGEADGEVKCVISTNVPESKHGVQWGCDYKHLYGVVKDNIGESIKLTFECEGSPALITDPANLRTRYVIMPLRLKPRNILLVK